MMSEEKKPNRITAHYATDEDYKRMNFYTIGMLYRAEIIATDYKERRREPRLSDSGAHVTLERHDAKSSNSD
jgi:hypothetical protein